MASVPRLELLGTARADTPTVEDAHRGSLASSSDDTNICSCSIRRAACDRFARPAGRARRGGAAAAFARARRRGTCSLSRRRPRGSHAPARAARRGRRAARRGAARSSRSPARPTRRSTRPASSSSTSRRPGSRSLSSRICEIGAVRIRRLEQAGVFETLVAPGLPLPRPVGRLTGLTDEELRARAARAAGVRGASWPSPAMRCSSPTTPASTSASSTASSSG